MKGKILLVDDNEDFIDSVKDVLEDEGYEVITAMNGMDALALTKSTPFDLVLMDIKMPVMNGVESFIRMKEKNPEVRVILFTAYALGDLIQKAHDEGVWAVLKKPLDMVQFVRVIDEARAKGEGGYILVADDDKMLCDNLFDTLTAAGHRVATACDGHEAIREAEMKAFDFLLLDMKLPKLNGLEVYRKVRKLQPRLVTILMTGYAEEMQDMIHQTISENAYTFLTKPFDMDQLLTLLSEITAAQRSGNYRKPGKEDRDAQDHSDRR